MTRLLAHLARVALPVICQVLASASAQAGNGLNVIGFGGESEMMGGADVAIARDTSALATNPAGLVQIRGSALDVFASPFYSIDVGHQDSVGNDAESNTKTGFIGGGGYARRLNSDVVAGIGLFTQGGVGYAYDDFDSGFGATGDLTSLFGTVKLVPGAACRINEQLSLGAGLNLTYTSARQKLFPDASIRNDEVPAASFYGSRIDGLKSFGLGYKLGLRYEPGKKWAVGLSFGSKVPLDLKDGEMTVNYQALGQGRVKYRDTRIDGLATAQDVSLGLAYTPDSRWLASLELSWLDWSAAVGEIRSTAKNPGGNPDPALVPARIESVTAVDFRDQLVIALGASWQWTEQTRLRGGFNYGRSPVTKRNLNPLFAVIAEPHYTLGLAQALSPVWDLDLGVQYQPHRTERYSNPAAPFTQDAEERNEAIYLSMGLSRRW